MAEAHTPHALHSGGVQVLIVFHGVLLQGWWWVGQYRPEATDHTGQEPVTAEVHTHTNTHTHTHTHTGLHTTEDSTAPGWILPYTYTK